MRGWQLQDIPEPNLRTLQGVRKMNKEKRKKVYINRGIYSAWWRLNVIFDCCAFSINDINSNLLPN